MQRPQIVIDRETVSSMLLPVSLAMSLVFGVLGATYVATIDKSFRDPYARIVDSLVTGTLGAVVGGGGVAMVMGRKVREEEERKKLADQKTLVE